MLNGCAIYVAKTKALTDSAVTAQLTAPFFSHKQKAGFVMTRLN